MIMSFLDFALSVVQMCRLFHLYCLLHCCIPAWFQQLRVAAVDARSSLLHGQSSPERPVHPSSWRSQHVLSKLKLQLDNLSKTEMGRRKTKDVFIVKRSSNTAHESSPTLEIIQISNRVLMARQFNSKKIICAHTTNS